MNDSAARAEFLALMTELEIRPIHVRHVARLALQLFDGLAGLHGLGARERLLLEAASHLHDIGHRSENPALGHHHESARMIRQHGWQNFTPPEVELIAQIARYHRKSMPEMEHEEFRKLRDWDRRLVQRLAALLRLADSLDKTHAQIIQSVGIDLPVNRIIFRIEASGPVVHEVRAAIRKGDLAMAVFQRDLFFMVGNEIVNPPEPSPV